MRALRSMLIWIKIVFGDKLVFGFIIYLCVYLEILDKFSLINGYKIGTLFALIKVILHWRTFYECNSNFRVHFDKYRR